MTEKCNDVTFNAVILKHISMAMLKIIIKKSINHIKNFDYLILNFFFQAKNDNFSI